VAAPEWSVGSSADMVFSSHYDGGHITTNGERGDNEGGNEMQAMMLQRRIVERKVYEEHLFIWPWSRLEFGRVNCVAKLRLRHPTSSPTVCRRRPPELSAKRPHTFLAFSMSSQSNVLEQQNNQRLEELSRKVTSLRNVLSSRI
jgi:hypothetical protein